VDGKKSSSGRAVARALVHEMEYREEKKEALVQSTGERSVLFERHSRQQPLAVLLQPMNLPLSALHRGDGFTLKLNDW